MAANLTGDGADVVADDGGGLDGSSRSARRRPRTPVSVARKRGLILPSRCSTTTRIDPSLSSTPLTRQAGTTSVKISPQKLALDANGDIFFADAGSGAATPYSAVYMLDLHTGYLRLIAGNAAGNCAGSDSYGDGCPATNAVIGNNGNGIGMTVDPLGNVYVTDAEKITNPQGDHRSGIALDRGRTQPLRILCKYTLPHTYRADHIHYI